MANKKPAEAGFYSKVAQDYAVFLIRAFKRDLVREAVLNFNTPFFTALSIALKAVGSFSIADFASPSAT